MRKLFAGKKTYVAAAVAAITAGASFATGELTGAQALQLGVTAVLSALLRSGSKSDAAAAAVGDQPK